MRDKQSGQASNENGAKYLWPRTLGIGLAIGAGMGVVVDNIAAGIGLGMAAGVAVGLALGRRFKSNSGND